MPGPAIKKHLADCTADVFNDVVRIYRHDINQYAGMLHTWMSLFETEVDPNNYSFTAATKKLENDLGLFVDNLQAHLYPLYLPNPDHAQQCGDHINDWWDRYFDGFTATVRPQLEEIKARLETYIQLPEFTATIQDTLGSSVNNERIDTLIFSTYTKLIALLDADHFDRRVDQVMKAQASAVANE
jgi:hypothetical protein